MKSTIQKYAEYYFFGKMFSLCLGAPFMLLLIISVTFQPPKQEQITPQTQPQAPLVYGVERL